MNWPAAVNVGLGIWLLLSPLIFGTLGTAAVQDTVAGILVVVCGVLSLWAARDVTLFSWLTLLIGIWVVFAPLWFDYFYLVRLAAQNDVITGLAIALFAALRIGRSRRVPV